MNVVGKVGTYISQSVYSVATPFHPFGGAVDIIVVQQQDGSFRSTPWYVRFGKFQGVLKGAEKIVKIEVNGVEADFHMYLDNSGEAYFIKEVIPNKDDEANASVRNFDTVDDTEDSISVECSNDENGRQENVNFQRNESNISDTVEARMLDDQAEGTESDSEKRFYEFQDEQSSLDDSLELSEYGSSRYDNLDAENFVESQNLSSEVVLMSVDGQILTAPITSSEGNAENVQLSTPQFHLGPVEGPDIVEGETEFITGEATWATDYLTDLHSSTTKLVSKNVFHSENNVKPIENNPGNPERGGEQSSKVQETQESEVQVSVPNDKEDAASSVKRDDLYEGDGEQVSKVEETQELEIHVSAVNNEEAAASSVQREDLYEEGGEKIPKDEETRELVRQLSMQSSNEDSVASGKREEIFGSCLELHELARQAEIGGLEVTVEDALENDSNTDVELVESGSLSVGGSSTVASNCESPDSTVASNCESPDLRVEFEPNDANALGRGDDILEAPAVPSAIDEQDQEEQIVITGAAEGIKSSFEGSSVGEKCTKSTNEEPQTSSIEDVKSEGRKRIELSLCGNLLRPGMGASAAAEAFENHRISEEDFQLSAASIIKNETLVIRIKEKYLPWEKAATYVLGTAAYGLDMPVESYDAIPVDPDESPKHEEGSGLPSTPSGRRWRLWPIPFRRVKTLEHTNSNASSEDVFVDTESGLRNQPAETSPVSGGSRDSPRKQVMRTNIPSTEQIASLNLKEGQNVVSFIFSTRVLGEQKVDAHIYLWMWNARIVISDVDGTITKSDVLGQFMPLVGKDWTQSGVARLFSAIKENGYQLLFLSARAIVQAYLTRSFLNNLKQDGSALPNGPVVISPDGLFPALYREVIRRAPHEFKIACLEDIKALFPPDYNPFYAGFGNRDTDELSYRKIGIPKGKIFIINPKGEVAISQRIDIKGKSYTSLHTLVDDMFPPTSMIEQEDFNSWNYWKTPLPDIDL